MINKISKKKNRVATAGFTLVEFIVVMVIFAVMSSVSLFNYNDYQRTIRETNIAQDIAGSIRQIQVYGLSGSDRVIGAVELDDGTEADDLFGDNGVFSDTFGEKIYDITQNQTVRGIALYPADKTMYLFEDTDGNNDYSQLDRVIDQRVWGGYSDINFEYCVIPEGSSPVIQSCEGSIPQAYEDPLVIMFQRPYPDAMVSYDGNSFSSALIFVSGQGESSAQYVEVNSIGRISIKKCEDYEYQDC